MTDRELMQQAIDFICSVMVHPSQIAARDAIADALEKRLAQPKQKPLTEKRIEELYSFWVVDRQDIVGFARAVERTVEGEA